MDKWVQHLAWIGLVVGSLLLLPAEGQASHEMFGVYEDWTSPAIRSDRWRGGENFGGQEVRREVEGGALQMRFRRGGETSSDTGTNASDVFVDVTTPLLLDQMQATFTVNSLAVTGCAANPMPSRAQTARVLLERLNDGESSGPFDRTGDLLAGIQAFRDSNSTDPPGVLQVSGFLAQCGNSNCSSSTTLSFVPLATVTVGTSFRLRLIWDAPNNQFLFGLNDNPDSALTYDATVFVQEAGSPFGAIDVRHITANCTAGPTVIDAATQVGTVLTNTSAIIP